MTQGQRVRCRRIVISHVLWVMKAMAVGVTPPQYYLRVPPTIQTVNVALAWSFHISVEDYHPAQETGGDVGVPVLALRSTLRRRLWSNPVSPVQEFIGSES